MESYGACGIRQAEIHGFFPRKSFDDERKRRFQIQHTHFGSSPSEALRISGGYRQRARTRQKTGRRIDRASLGHCELRSEGGRRNRTLSGQNDKGNDRRRKSLYGGRRRAELRDERTPVPRNAVQTFLCSTGGRRCGLRARVGVLRLASDTRETAFVPDEPRILGTAFFERRMPLRAGRSRIKIRNARGRRPSAKGRKTHQRRRDNRLVQRTN